MARFAEFVAARYTDPMDVLAAHMEDAMAAAASVGAKLDGMPKLDGARHYLPNAAGVNERRHYYRASVEADPDGTVWPCVTFGTFKHGGTTAFWKPRDLVWREFEGANENAQTADPKRIAEYRRRAAEMLEAQERRTAERNAEEASGEKAAAETAAEVWAAAKPCNGHDYLTAKGVQAHGLRLASADHRARLYSKDDDAWRVVTAVRAGDLLVPMIDTDGMLWNLQRIDANGEKRFITGSRKRGLFHRIEGAGRAWLAEGYATAASVHAATGSAVIVGFDAGNLQFVAEALSGQVEAVAADHDANGAGLKGAKATGLPYAMPPAAGDWNDHASRHGLESVAQLLRQRAHHAPATSTGKTRAAGKAGAQPKAKPAANDNGAAIFSKANPYRTAIALADTHWTNNGCRALHHRIDGWFQYTGKRYEPRDVLEVRAQLWQHLDAALCYSGKGEQMELVPFSPKSSDVNNVADALGSHLFLRAGEIGRDCWLENVYGWDAHDVIAMQNGLLHLPTGAMAPHDPRFFSQTVLTFDYASDAPEPVNWLAMLRAQWAENPQAIECLQEYMGCMLAGDTRYHKALQLIGPRRSGKGTIARVMTQLMGGAENCPAPRLSQFGDRFGLACLLGKRAAVVADARLSGKADKQEIIASLLAITGEDSIDIDRKHRDSVSARLAVLLVICSNEMLHLPDASGALASRFLTLGTTQSFYGREDHDLDRKLSAELPGIFNWAVRGLRRLRANGRFTEPDSSVEAREEMTDLGSPVQAFVREMCVLEPTRWIATEDLFAAYECWAAPRRHTVIDLAVFGKALKSAHGIQKARPRVGGSRAQVYQGIALRCGGPL